MQYWYSIKGNSAIRGQADELVLFEMAKNGKLKPSDLVWSTSTGSRWVPASTIEGMFSQAALAEAARSSGQPEPAVAQSPAGKQHHWIKTVVVAAALLLVTCVMAFIAMKLVKSAKPPPKQDFLKSLEEEARSTFSTGDVAVGSMAVGRDNAVASLRDRIAACFAKDQLDESAKLIEELRKTEGGAEFAQRLAVRLDGLRRTASRKGELENALSAGTLDKAGAEELFTIVMERKEEARLQSVTEGLLREKSAITPASSLSAARMCRAAGWRSLQKTALREFCARATMSGPDTDYLEVVNMYSALGEPLKGIDLLSKYLTNSPRSSAAWLELAALQCSAGGDSKAAMAALKQAVEGGGQDACSAARRDARFDSIRNTSAFRNLIGIK